MHNPEIAIIGGGAAGFFAAIQLAKLLPNARMVIFEQSGEVLQKVKISGGGRCNVTHACYEPKELVKHYPRGEKELLGPFHKFGPAEMTAWLEKEGVR
jgi:predicted flavoprotein YhiN